MELTLEGQRGKGQPYRLELFEVVLGNGEKLTNPVDLRLLERAAVQRSRLEGFFERAPSGEQTDLSLERARAVGRDVFARRAVATMVTPGLASA